MCWQGVVICITGVRNAVCKIDGMDKREGPGSSARRILEILPFHFFQNNSSGKTHATAKEHEHYFQLKSEVNTKKTSLKCVDATAKNACTL